MQYVVAISISDRFYGVQRDGHLSFLATCQCCVLIELLYCGLIKFFFLLLLLFVEWYFYDRI